MDEIIQAIFGLLVVLTIAAAIALAVAALLSVGVIYGAAIAVYNYFTALSKDVRFETAKSSSITAGAGEPAIKSYFFGKGYRDLKATIGDCWKANQAFSQDIWNRAATASVILLRALHYGAAASCMIYGTLFFGILSALHVVILGLCYVIIFALFTLVFLIERAYLTLKGFLTVCPNCHVQTPLPIYLCDGCGSQHRRLLPSSYGILHHRCICGQRLPATFFVNRGRLPAKCAHCETFLSRVHTEAQKLFVPVIGGPSTGKTAYLTWLVDELKRRASKAGQDVEFLNPAEAAEFETRLQGMSRGEMPAKTTSTTPTAINLIFSENSRVNRNLYLYDPAGEAYGGEAELAPHHFLSYCSGILFLIDPFSIPAVQTRYRIDDPSRADAIKPSLQRPDDLLDRFLFVLEKHFGLDAAASIDIPLAVVLTKVDAFNLESVVGEIAFTAAASAESDRVTARNEFVSQRLREWGMITLLEVIESRFSKRAYFTCSAVGFGHRAGTGFVPQRVAPPFLWLMQEAKTGFLTGEDESAASAPTARPVMRPTKAAQGMPRDRSDKYHVLLSRAVSGLIESTYAERGALYDRARQALSKQLRSSAPALSESEIELELSALEKAITRIEAAAEV